MPHYDAITANTLIRDGYAFEHIETGFESAAMSTMAFSGRLVEVAREIARIPEGELPEQALWTPARLVRGIIDHTFETPNRIQLITEAASVALALYAGEPVGQRLPSVIEAIRSAGLLDEMVIQTRDGISCQATNPILSSRSADKILSEAPGEDILMITLAHGGVAAGMHTFLYHVAQTGPNSNSAMYPIRLSLGKHKDTEPFMTDDEKDYLRSLIPGRR